MMLVPNADNVNDMSIIIEDTSQNGLSLAATLLHEGIDAEIYRYVNRRKSGVDPNDRPRVFQLYAYYKDWSDKYNDPGYNWRSTAQHHYMVENYVNQIASAVRELDGNKYPLSYYMAYGWTGLTKYGYDAKVLTKTQEIENNRLKNIVDLKAQLCK